MKTFKPAKKSVRPSARGAAMASKQPGRATLVIELSKAQRERVYLVSSLLQTSPEDFVRMMVFSGLDSEFDWPQFRQFAEAYLDTRASGAASEAPAGTRVEDQAPERFLRLVG